MIAFFRINVKNLFKNLKTWVILSKSSQLNISEKKKILDSTWFKCFKSPFKEYKMNSRSWCSFIISKYKSFLPSILYTTSKWLFLPLYVFLLFCEMQLTPTATYLIFIYENVGSIETLSCEERRARFERGEACCDFNKRDMDALFFKIQHFACRCY